MNNGYCNGCIITKIEKALKDLTENYENIIEIHGAKREDSVGARLGTVFGSLPYFAAKAQLECYLLFKSDFCNKIKGRFNP